jgi:hypothetical protein
MASQPKPSGIPWLGLVVVAGLMLLALGGGGLLVYVWLSASAPSAAPPPAPVATQAAGTQVAVQPAFTAAAIPTATPETAGAGAATSAPATESAASAAAPTEAAPTDTATPTVTPEPALTILQSANIRSGPGLVYPVIGSLAGGRSLPAIGRDSAGRWYVIGYSGSARGQGWVSSQVATYSGDTGSLPVIQAPPPPPPTPTPVPPTAIPPTNPPPPSAHGMQGSLSLCESRTTYAAGERICVIEKIYNASNNNIDYGVLGVNAANITGGPSWFQSSWTGYAHANNVLTLLPGCTGPVGLCDGPWEDGFKLQAGTYQFYLSICYSNAKTCQGGGVWETLTAPITVVVQ